MPTTPIPHAPPMRRPLLHEAVRTLTSEVPAVTGVAGGTRCAILHVRGYTSTTHLTFASAVTTDGGLSLERIRAGLVGLDELPTIWTRAFEDLTADDVVLVYAVGHCSSAIDASLRALASESGLALATAAKPTSRLLAELEPLTDVAKRSGFSCAPAEMLASVCFAEVRPDGYKAPSSWPRVIKARFHSDDAYVAADFDSVHADASFVQWGKTAGACALTTTGAWAATDVSSATRIVDAELAGIAEAVRLARFSTREEVTVYCDSKPALSLIRRARASGGVTVPAYKPSRLPLLDILRQLTAPGPCIRFAWEPGHSGSALNEACDRVARHIARCAGAGVLDGVTVERLAEIVEDETRAAA